MENRPLGPEEQDDVSDKKSSKKKRSGNALSRYLSGLRHKEEQGERTTGDSEAEKPRRARRLFSRLFPSIVENPSKQQETSPDITEHGFDQEIWSSWTRFTSREAEQPTDASEESTAPETADAHQGPVAVEQDVPHDLVDTEPDTDERRVLPVANPVQESAPREAQQVAEIPSEPQRAGHDAILYAREYDRVGGSESYASKKPSTEKEVIIERGAGIALPTALVGLEYLARKKADKKLEARVTDKVQAISREQQRGAQLQEELNRVVRQNREQLDELRRAREGSVERSVTDRSTYARTPEAAPEQLRQPNAAEPTRRPESVPETVKPRNIMERVADAAEHDVPVERAFERSHEVKDDRSAVSTGAASVGSVVSGYAVDSSRAGGDRPVSVTNHDGGLPVVTEQQASMLYKQAAATGFWSAVVIMVLGLVAWLVIK